MRRAWLVLAMAGFGGSAIGQTIVTDLVVSLTFDRTSIGIGETAVATMTASWGGTGLYLSSVNVDLIASGQHVQVSEAAAIEWANPALGWDGAPLAIDGASIIGLQGAQFSLIPPFTTDNPILITTFVVTGTVEGSLSYHTVDAAGAPFPFGLTSSWIGDVLGEFGNDVFVSQTLVVTPGPGTAALVIVAGVGGFGRRRR